jgi:hypothetical protein
LVKKMHIICWSGMIIKRIIEIVIVDSSDDNNHQVHLIPNSASLFFPCSWRCRGRSWCKCKEASLDVRSSKSPYVMDLTS